MIHGDLKSSNIFITREPDGSIRAVITDFGLAREPASTVSALQSGALFGTPDYMAPELWKGKKPSVASDIYALGVILREMAPAKAPPAWTRTVQRCVNADPALRFKSAGEVARALAPQTRRWFLATAAAALLAVVSGLFTYDLATTPAEKILLAVLPFESGQDLAPLAARLSGEVKDELSRLRPSERTRLIVIPTVASAAGARDKSPAKYVLRASLAREDGNIALQAWLTDTKSQANAQQWKATYATSELRYIPVALAGMVTGTLHLPAVPDLATVNAAALQDYRSGLDYIRRESTVDSGLPLLERAVAADPDSPLTHAALAEGRWWKYHLTHDKSWRVRSAESVQEARRRNADLPEVLRISGLLDADAGQYENAEAAYLRAVELDPENADAYRRLGLAYDHSDASDKALAALRRAVELAPQYYQNHLGLGFFFYTRADYRQAAAHFATAVRVEPNESTPYFALATAHIGLGRYKEAEADLREALLRRETSDALNTLGSVLMYEGRDQEAVPYFTRALSRFPEQYLWWMNLGTVYRRLNLPTDAKRANRRALELADIEIKNNPRSAYTRSCLAYLSAWLGDHTRAESEIVQALRLEPGDSMTLRMAVKTYEALRRRDDALAVLSTSPRDVLADVARYPDLADLQQDPRFQKLFASSAK